MVATTKGKPKPTDELKQIVNEIAESMNEPPWQSKLLEAMDFVLTDAVDIDSPNITVKSGAHAYEIDPQYGCSCTDSRVRNKRYCKHFVAFEMQKRVSARMRGEDMPAKSTPQDEWEAGIQSGRASAEPVLFDEPEPDDIPEPEVPKHVKQAAEKLKVTAKLTPEGQAMVDRGELKVGDSVTVVDEETLRVIEKAAVKLMEAKALIHEESKLLEAMEQAMVDRGELKVGDSVTVVDEETLRVIEKAAVKLMEAKALIHEESELLEAMEQAMVDRGELKVGDSVTVVDEETLRVIEEAIAHNGVVRTEGHQYVDHPSTLCIKRHVGQTEIMWTFRGPIDEEVWGRASRMIRTLDEANKRYVPPPQAPSPQEVANAPVIQATSAPQIPQPVAPPVAQATYVDTAAGAVPICPVHNRSMSPSKFGGFYCTGKNPDGSYCKTKA